MLWLKRLWESTYLAGSGSDGSHDTSPNPDNNKKAQQHLLPQASGRASGKFAPKPGSPQASAAALAAAGPAAHGVAQLLSHWSSVLRSNMAAGPPAPSAAAAFNPASAEFSVDSMGPIFHNVLTNLTSDYERRLCTKDQDLSRAREAFHSLQSQMTEVQRHLDGVKKQLENQQHGQASNAAHAAEIAELQATIEGLRAELAESQRRCAELQWRLDNAGQASVQQVS